MSSVRPDKLSPTEQQQQSAGLSSGSKLAITALVIGVGSAALAGLALIGKYVPHSGLGRIHKAIGDYGMYGAGGVGFALMIGGVVALGILKKKADEKKKFEATVAQLEKDGVPNAREVAQLEKDGVLNATVMARQEVNQAASQVASRTVADMIKSGVSIAAEA